MSVTNKFHKALFNTLIIKRIQIFYCNVFVTLQNVTILIFSNLTVIICNASALQHCNALALQRDWSKMLIIKILQNVALQKRYSVNTLKQLIPNYLYKIHIKLFVTHPEK